MHCPRIRFVSTVVVLAATAATARSDIIWHEAVNGDLSDNRLIPTVLTIAEGSNELLGILEGVRGDDSIDRDYYTVTIPQGLVLSEIVLDAYLSNDFAAFIGVQPGPIFPNSPDTVQPGDLMGWTLYGPSQVDLNILPLMGANGQGFTPPLGPGTYTLWTQQIGDFTEYVMDFIVVVPSPSGALTLAGGMALARRRRR